MNFIVNRFRMIKIVFFNVWNDLIVKEWNVFFEVRFELSLFFLLWWLIVEMLFYVKWGFIWLILRKVNYLFLTIVLWGDVGIFLFYRLEAVVEREEVGGCFLV